MTLSDGLLQRVSQAQASQAQASQAQASQAQASQAQASQAQASRCPQCGGSGMLRLGDQRYRTCLDCLGQGQVVQAELQRRAALPISVSASSAAR